MHIHREISTSSYHKNQGRVDPERSVPNNYKLQVGLVLGDLVKLARGGLEAHKNSFFNVVGIYIEEWLVKPKM